MFVASTDHHVATSASDLVQYANRTLDLINAIEKTIRVALRDTDVIRAIAKGLRSMANDLHKVSPEVALDPESRARELLLLAAAAAERSGASVAKRCESARVDHRLEEDDGVVECLEGLGAAFADLQASIIELAEAVDVHEALRSPVTGTYANVEELIASLKS